MDSAVSATRLLAIDNERAAIHLFATTSTLTDVITRSPTETGGVAFEAGSMQGSRFEISRCWNFCMLLGDLTAELTDLDVSQLHLQSVEPTATAIGIQRGAEVTLTRARIHDVIWSAFLVEGTGSTLHADDLHLADIQEGIVRSGGGIVVTNGAHFDGRRVKVENVPTLGIYAARSSLVLSDLVIDRVFNTATSTEPPAALYVDQNSTLSLENAILREADFFGLGVLHSDAEVRRARIEDHKGVGVYVDYEESDVLLEDVSVLRTTSDLNGLFGRGIHVGGRARVRMDRAVFAENAEAGVLAFEGLIDAVDLSIRDTKTRTLGELFGIGLMAIDRGEITVERGSFERNRETGAHAERPGSKITLKSVDIYQTRESECVNSTCRGRASGTGVGAYDGASVIVEDFLITRSALAGVRITAGAEVTLRDGEVSFNPIGASIDERYDVSRLLNEVVFHDNTNPFDSRELPSPLIGDQLPTPR
jgi:hypothetical protein